MEWNWWFQLFSVQLFGLAFRAITVLQVLSEIFPEGSVSTYPCGQDVSAVVQKIGENVTNVSVGDEVVGMRNI